MSLAELKRDLKAAGTPERAAGAARFCKTGKGEYGEGVVFLGITASDLRAIVKRHRGLSLDELEKLLASREHESRAAALLILADQYTRGEEAVRKDIFDLYLRNTQQINNWALVDCSCREIVGAHLQNRSRSLLTKLAKSESVWERRIAMVSTRTFVREGNFGDALRIAEMLLSDRHDLIHKAVGWVLREVGDGDRAALLRFLKHHYAHVPRTTLRYAIEHFSAEDRKKVLAGDFSLSRATLP